MRLSKPLLAAGSVLLLATCDAITAPEPKRVAVRYAADSVLVRLRALRLRADAPTRRLRDGVTVRRLEQLATLGVRASVRLGR